MIEAILAPRLKQVNIPIIIIYTHLEETDNYVNLIPHVNEDERRRFLEMYFSADNSEFVRNYLSINRDIYVIRDYSAGSNATTILCNDGKNNFYRKYAFGKDGHKLYAQVQWIRKYKDIIPLTNIVQDEHTDDYCYYDMPYYSNAIGLFDYAHSAPIEDAWNFVRLTLECLENSLYKIDNHPADRDTVRQYVTEKVTGNLKKIYKSKQISPLLKYESININGIPYKNLPYYQRHLTEEYLWDVFKNDTYSDIHGDLTIENIVCTKNIGDEDGFYIIDPNTGNVHNSPNLDYAKLLQSIHGNYEFFMATKKIHVIENNLDFKFIKSDAYTYLLDKMDAYMNENFEQERVRSIYFHEIIHWLRLMPYKINKIGNRALLFYAGLLIVLDDVVRRYGD